MFNHGIREVKSQLAENGNPAPEFKVDYITAFAVEIPVAADDVPSGNTDHGQLGQDFRQVSDQVKSLILCLSDKYLPKTQILELGKLNKSLPKSRETLEQKYLNPAIEAGYVAMTIPDKPKSSKQKYYLTEKGKAIYQEIVTVKSK